jgi:hypothetical protein
MEMELRWRKFNCYIYFTTNEAGLCERGRVFKGLLFAQCHWQQQIPATDQPEAQPAAIWFIMREARRQLSISMSNSLLK